MDTAAFRGVHIRVCFYKKGGLVELFTIREERRLGAPENFTPIGKENPPRAPHLKQFRGCVLRTV